MSTGRQVRRNLFKNDKEKVDEDLKLNKDNLSTDHSMETENDGLISQLIESEKELEGLDISFNKKVKNIAEKYTELLANRLECIKRLKLLEIEKRRFEINKWHEHEMEKLMAIKTQEIEKLLSNDDTINLNETINIS